MTVGLLAREDASIGGGVLTLGLNHQTAPLELRERLAFSPERIIPTLRDFHGRFGQVAAANESSSSKRTEAALLSTCNRTELYFGAHPELTEPALGWLADLSGVSQGRLAEHAYILHGSQAARHAFRVASGLDSMVLGEPQILGQLKQAVREAGTAGTLGSTLNQLFQRSFSVAKEVRTATEIGSHSISMAAAAVRLASQLFEDLADTRVLFVGAGEMIELAATHFAAREPRHIAVANRTLERAEKLSQRFGAEAVRLADLPSRLAEFDIVVSCTASSLPIIGLGAVERALKLRKHRPMFMVDLAVPRDIEPEVAALGDIYLYTVDDLSEAVQTAGEKRQAAVAQAEAIIETGVRGFQQWLDQRSAVPLIQALQAQTNSWRDRELSRARRQLARGEHVDTVLDALSRGLMQKMLHGALAELNHADPADRARLAETVSRLFLRASPTSVAASTPEDDHR